MSIIPRRRRAPSQFDRAADGSMPLMEHLRELRSRLLKACLAILLGGIVCYLFSQDALKFLQEPYCVAVHKPVGQCGFTYLGVTEYFVLKLKLALYLGLIVAGPVWLYQLWAFIAPGLHKHERRWAYGFAAVAAPLFAAGAVLAFLVVHRGLQFLLPSKGDGILNQMPIANYVSFVINMMLVFGLAFEFPLVICMLNLTGLISARRLLRWWRVSVFLMFAIAAVVTPTPDPFGMCAMALPMVALYFAAVGFAFWNDRRRARKRSAEFGAVDDDEASPLVETNEPIDELEPVSAPNPLDESYDEAPRERSRRNRRIDDST